MTDAEGAVRWSGQYGSFGEVSRQTEGFYRLSGLTSLHHQPLRYAGQYADRETGLHYNLFRYYDPQVGRFTVQDPIGLAGGWNLYQYAPNPFSWIDPLGLQRKCSQEDEPNWTPHGYKHVAPKNSTWRDVIKSTKSGPAKYKPGTDIESLERSVYKNGQSVTNGKSWKVKEMDEVIGASEGKESRWLRVEKSGGTIHGHPISLNEFSRLIK
ncbi:RHS repeat-associated protein [Pantoea cypripedii]|nr:RHS repeat-associated protein [Pantoea cypripedii]